MDLIKSFSPTEIFKHPLFWLGVLIKLVVIVVGNPQIAESLYIPFLLNDSSYFPLNPWSSWISEGGRIDAFPYGYSMWLLFFPFVYLAEFIGSPLIGYFLVIFLCDLLILLIIYELANKANLANLLGIYWLSPVVIFISFYLGLNDLIPSALLLLSILFISKDKVILSGVFLGASVSTKISMLIAFPFFLIFLISNFFDNKRLILKFFIAFILISLGGLLPLLVSEGGRMMLFGNPELTKILSMKIEVDETSELFLLPFAYCLLAYLGWRTKPLNFSLLVNLISISLLSIALFTPASPGWFLWSLPFLALYQLNSDRISIYLCALLSICWLSVLIAKEFFMFGEWLTENTFLFVENSASSINELDFIVTFIAILGILISIRMYRTQIFDSDFYRFYKKPISIGITGDSGSGKDTIVDAIESFIGNKNVTKVSGDDYHKWDRHKPMWSVLTHLNPASNNLKEMGEDIVSLKDGKSIFQQHYDHSTGKMTKPAEIASNQFIIASGLHTLFFPVMREAFDITIYLDIDEDLRRYFKLKRDVIERGHSEEDVLESIQKRIEDSKKYVQPQKKFAQVIFSLKPKNLDDLNNLNKKKDINLELMVNIKNTYNEYNLHKVLVGICGLNVDLDHQIDDDSILLRIDGDPSPEDIEQAAKILAPNIFVFISQNPKWFGSTLGLMQLIILMQIELLISKRRIK